MSFTFYSLCPFISALVYSVFSLQKSGRLVNSEFFWGRREGSLNRKFSNQKPINLFHFSVKIYLGLIKYHQLTSINRHIVYYKRQFCLWPLNKKWLYISHCYSAKGEQFENLIQKIHILIWYFFFDISFVLFACGAMLGGNGHLYCCYCFLINWDEIVKLFAHSYWI